jgi:hypothetical protein
MRLLLADLSPRRYGFDPRAVHLGFAVDKVGLKENFLRVLGVSPAHIIPVMLVPQHRRCINISTDGVAK